MAERKAAIRANGLDLEAMLAACRGDGQATWRIQSVPQPDGSRSQWSESCGCWRPAGDPTVTTYLHPEDARDRLGVIRCAGISGAGGAQVVEVKR